MKTSNKITNYHLDKNIILFFVITILASATVFAFKYVNYAPCEIIDFSMDKIEARVNQSIKFEDNTIAAQEWKWNFGDGSEVDSGKSTYHSYSQPGEYEVSLIVNGKCSNIKKITVLEKKEVLDPLKKAKFEILTKKLRVGEKLKLEDKTLNAKTWEWRFEDEDGATSTIQNPEYIYTSAGRKKISLMVNGEIKYVTTKTIEVLPKKEEKVRRPPTTIRPPITEVIPIDPILEEPVVVEDEPEEVKVTFIGKESFKKKLMLVTEKKETVNDFNEYFCGNLDLSIMVNKKRTTFREFCEKIKGKRIVIRELALSHEGNNCIKNIVVKYRRLGIL